MGPLPPWEIFTGAKFRGNASRLFRRNFRGFYFHEMNVWHCDHTPTVDGHTPHANRRNDIKRQSEEVSLCNNGLDFLLHGGLCNHKSIMQDCRRGRETGLLNGRIQHCWSWLWQLWSISYRFDGICTVAGRFRGQPDCREPSRSHGYKFISTYTHNDIIHFILFTFHSFY